MPTTHGRPSGRSTLLLVATLSSIGVYCMTTGRYDVAPRLVLIVLSIFAVAGVISAIRARLLNP